MMYIGRKVKMRKEDAVENNKISSLLKITSHFCFHYLLVRNNKFKISSFRPKTTKKFAVALNNKDPSKSKKRQILIHYLCIREVTAVSEN